MLVRMGSNGDLHHMGTPHGITPCAQFVTIRNNGEPDKRICEYIRKMIKEHEELNEWRVIMRSNNRKGQLIKITDDISPYIFLRNKYKEINNDIYLDNSSLVQGLEEVGQLNDEEKL